MRRAPLTLALVLACCAGTATVALAAREFADRDDSPSTLDIRSVAGAHDSRDRLVHLVRTYEAFDPADLLNRRGPPGSVCVNIWTRRRPGEAGPDYDACATADASGRRFRGSVSRHGARGGVRRVAGASVEHPRGSRKLLIRFDPDSIRRPRSYRWDVESTTFGSRCRRATGCEDTAPNAPRTIVTSVRRRR